MDKKVDMPDNWRGYDQTGRDDFFGMIEIPFDYRLIKKRKKFGVSNIPG